jgi:hypothetical protein
MEPSSFSTPCNDWREPLQGHRLSRATNIVSRIPWQRGGVEKKSALLGTIAAANRRIHLGHRGAAQALGCPPQGLFSAIVRPAGKALVTVAQLHRLLRSCALKRFCLSFPLSDIRVGVIE